MKHLILLISALGSALFFTSCAVTTPAAQSVTQKSTYVNPYPPGTHEHFTARQDYLQTLEIYRNDALYFSASSSETSIELDSNTLRGRLFNGKQQVILDYPIATGKAEHPTPKGQYKILEKIVDKESNLYGKIIDANGVVLNAKAESRKHPVPPGARFDGADMPYWMRLTTSGIGMHQGYVPRAPASHGCIRHTMDGVQQVYSKVKIGTPVTIR